MRIDTILFRVRVPIFVSLYLLGFLVPWQRLSGTAATTLWLAASTQLARSRWLGLENATMAVTLGSLACLASGALLRLWGTAYLGAATMQGTVLHGAAVISAGPYGHLRNPLYLGSWLIAIGTSILMPLAGALFFICAFTSFLLYLLFSEARCLSATAGVKYQEYCRQVPRLLPRLTRAKATATRPRWLPALLAEAYPVGFTLCFAVSAWRFNARVLIQGLLICYGVALILSAFAGKSPATA